MLRRIEETLVRFRVRIDSWQRQTRDRIQIPAAIAELDTYEADGAVWARTSEYGDDKDRVLIRSNGEPTYFALTQRTSATSSRDSSARSTSWARITTAYVARLKALAAMLGADPPESRRSSTSSST